MRRSLNILPSTTSNHAGRIRDSDDLRSRSLVQVICAGQLQPHQRLHQRCLHRGKGSPRRKHRRRIFGRTASLVQERQVYIEVGKCEGSGSHLCRPYARQRSRSKREIADVQQAVYQSLLHLSWVDRLLDNIRVLFVDLYGDQIKKPHSSVVECDFDGYFNQQVKELEGSAEPSQKSPPIIRTEPPSQADSDHGSEEPPPPAPLPLSNQKRPDSATASTDVTPTSTPDTSRPNTPSNGHLLTAKAGRGPGTSRRARKAASSTAADNLKKADKPIKAKGKKMRRWDADGLVDEDDSETPLDYSVTSDADSKPMPSSSNLESIDISASGTRTSKGQYILKDLDDEVHSILQKNATAKSQTQPTSSSNTSASSVMSSISSLFRNVVGGKVLTKADLEKPLRGMEEHLLKKNVAREAA
ncbi:MAG: hypothetical protein Q9222_007905, partial [Ikaeria aurantiellina]